MSEAGDKINKTEVSKQEKPMTGPFNAAEVAEIKNKLEGNSDVMKRVEEDAISLTKIAESMGQKTRMVFIGFAAILASHLSEPNEASADMSAKVVNVDQKGAVEKAELKDISPEVKAYKNQLDFMLQHTRPMTYNGEDKLSQDYADAYNKTLQAIEYLKEDDAKLQFLTELKQFSIPIFEIDEDGNSPESGLDMTVDELMKTARGLSDDTYFDALKENIAEKQLDIEQGMATFGKIQETLKNLSSQYANRKFLPGNVAQK